MGVSAIDPSRIQAMILQLKAAAQKPEPSSVFNIQALTAGDGAKANRLNAMKLDFSEALKSSLNQVNSSQSKADALGKKFALGDDSISLSDVMIAGQKANISFQGMIQVRNKLVSAYQEVMSMQI